MLENSTINIASYLTATSDTSTGSGSKSYMDKSSDFANIFDNVNKTISNQDNGLKASTNEPKSNKVEKQEPQIEQNREKTELKSSSENEKMVDEKNEDETSNIENSSKSESSEESQKKTQTEKSEAETSDSEAQNDNSAKDENKSSTVADNNKPEAATNPSTEINKGLITENLMEMLQTLPASENAVLATLKSDNSISSLEIKEVDATTALEPILAEVGTNFEPTQLAQLAQNLTTNGTTQKDTIKVQPQTQQALSNIKIEQQDFEVQKPQPDNILETKIENNTPLIKVNTEIIASDSNINTNASDITGKQNIKDMLNKTSLTQDMLDKTNAKIVSLSTSNTGANSNNLLDQQNAGEQSIKFSLQGNNQDNNLAGLSNAATQANFTKAIDGVQSQAPQELNKADILSQIYNKLDTLKDEKTTTINIVLRPEGLGKINLELISGKDGLSAKMTTDNAQVKELLDKSLNSLKDTLGNQGVQVNTVTVKVEETQKQSHDMFSFNQGQSQTGNQEFSNNAQKQNQNTSAFGEEIDNALSTTDSITEAENTAKISSHTGQVDYKI